MDFLQINGKEIPLLEAPQQRDDSPRRVFYVLFKHKTLICVIFLLLIVPMFIYLLFRTTYYFAATKVLLNPSRVFLNLSPTSGTSAVSMDVYPEMFNTEIQIITGPELAQRLATDITFPDEPNGKNRSEVEIRSDAGRIRGLLKAIPVRSTNLIQISVTSSKDPAWIVSVVNRAAELY